MDYEKEINGKKYIWSGFVWLTGINANQLHIEFIKDGNQFYEEIIGRANFIQDITFSYLDGLNGEYSGSKDIDLTIRKGGRTSSLERINIGSESFDFEDSSMEDSARANFSDYLSTEQDPKDFGLADCISTGFSHLTIDDSGNAECILILEDYTFNTLLSLLKTNSLRGFGFAARYLCIYTEEHSNQGHMASKNQSVYLIKSEDNKYPNSTFGALSEITIHANEWSSTIDTEDKSISDNSLISTETQKQIFSQLSYMSNLLLYGFTVLIILLMLIIIF